MMQIANGIAKNNVILQSGEQLLVMFQAKQSATSTWFTE